MIKQARYSKGSREVVITASEPDAWLEMTESVINFPGPVELDGDNLDMSDHRSRHGGVEPIASVILRTLKRAAAGIDKRLKIELVDCLA